MCMCENPRSDVVAMHWFYADRLAGVATGSQWPKLALHPTPCQGHIETTEEEISFTKKSIPTRSGHSSFAVFQSVQPWCSKFAIKTFITGMFISRIQMQWLIHVKAQSVPKPVQVRELHAPGSADSRIWISIHATCCPFVYWTQFAVPWLVCQLGLWKPFALQNVQAVLFPLLY